MKSCASQQNRIVRMVSDDLTANESESLRRHLDQCPDCRLHARRMKALTQRLQNLDLPPGEATAAFHARLVQRISARKTRSPGHDWAVALFQWCGRRGFATALALAAAVVLTRQISRHITSGDDPAPAHLASDPTPSAIPVAGGTTRLAAYRLAAETSLDHLDEMLARQVARGSFPVETYTMMSLEQVPWNH